MWHDRGNSYLAAKNYIEAIKCFKKAVTLHPAQIFYTKHLALAYQAAGQPAGALAAYQKTAQFWRARRNQSKEAEALNQLGNLYFNLSRHAEAMKYYHRVWHIQLHLKNSKGQADVLTNMGHAFAHLGHQQKALTVYQKALPIFRRLKDYGSEALLLNNMAAAYSGTGQRRKALTLYNKSRTIHRHTGDRKSTATTLGNIGLIYAELGQPNRAKDIYREVLPVIRSMRDKSAEALTFLKLMLCHQDLQNAELSIFYGKLAVNLIQQLRKNLTGLDHQITSRFFKSNDHAYRHTAGLLVKAGRIGEAQQLLDILKLEEYLSFIYWGNQPAHTNRTRPIPAGQHTHAHSHRHSRSSSGTHNHDAPTGRTGALSAEFQTLDLTPFEQQWFVQLNQNLDPANPQAFFPRLEKAFSRHRRDGKKTGADSEGLTGSKHLQKKLRLMDGRAGGKNAVLHYLMHKDRIYVIITTARSQTMIHTVVDEKSFNRDVMVYKTLVVKSATMGHRQKRGVQTIDSKDPDDLSRQFLNVNRKLYQILFKPVVPQLEKYGTENLLISLDGVLRYIPISTLWDGNNYLLQRYRISRLTASGLRDFKGDLNKNRPAGMTILGMGTGLGGSGFTPLPHVPGEIRAIVRDETQGYDTRLIRGKAFVNERFTRNVMLTHLSTGNFPLVHIAGHFKFSPGDERKNRLLRGDGTTMTLKEIRNQGKLFKNVELLTLSACETGTGGNGEEIDGFGELARQGGARNIIASLWPVADRSTKELMVTFYKYLTQGRSIIEALRQAQLKLAGLPDLLNKKSMNLSPFEHPYYWGPFIIMSNGNFVGTTEETNHD